MTSLISKKGYPVRNNFIAHKNLGQEKFFYIHYTMGMGALILSNQSI